MITSATAGLLRRAQDLGGDPMPARPDPRLAARGEALTAAARTPRGEALLPPLAEGQYEPQPSTMSFAQFLSGLNPLQHVPVVGTIYRAITGDVPPTVMRVLGGFLTGGAVGGILTALGAAAEDIVSRARASDVGDAATTPAIAQPAEAPPAVAATGHGGGLRVIPRAEDAGERLNRLRAAGDLYGRHQAPRPLPSPAAGVRPPLSEAAG